MSVFCSFFFSSRRRHTRLQGDWSSDVCSSDLDDRPPRLDLRQEARERLPARHAVPAPADAAARSATSSCNRSAIADRKSTRLNSSHLVISYAVFCLKKKKAKRRTV